MKRNRIRIVERIILGVIVIVGLIWAMDQKYLSEHRDEIEKQVKKIISQYKEVNTLYPVPKGQDKIEGKKRELEMFYYSYGTKNWADKKTKDTMFYQELQKSLESGGFVKKVQVSNIKIGDIVKMPFQEKVSAKVSFQINLEGKNDMQISFGAGVYGIESEEGECHRYKISIQYLLLKEQGRWKIEKIDKEQVKEEVFGMSSNYIFSLTPNI